MADVDSTSALWIDHEDAAEAIPPPVSTRFQVLPLEKLSWESLERLCYRLALRTADMADCRRYGIQGQDQQGIDIYVRQALDGKYTTWQCKRYGEFTASDLRKAVAKFLKHDWAKTSATFHLAVSVSLAPTDLADAVEEQAKECKSVGIEFVPLDADRLSDLLKPHPDLVDDFFGRPWVEAFCGSEAARKLSGRRLSKPERIRARQKLRELYSTHFASVDIGLPATTGALRNVAPYFPLRKRYVVPSVEGLQTVIEPRIAPPETRASHTASQPTLIPPQQASADDRVGEPSGFKVTEQRTKNDLLAWLATVQQAVIIGGPGSGKSAGLRFLALDLLSDEPRSESIARRWGNYLPLFVPFAMLTRLVAAQEVVSIADFLKGWLRKLTAPQDTIALLEQALDDERLLLLIDGLDEWTDSTAANTALVKILDFAIPRRLPVVASARRSGYEKLGGLGTDWKKAELLPLDEKQQREFTGAWFTHFHTATLQSGSSSDAIKSAAHRDTDAFMTEVQPDDALSTLAGIPLLLSALIYLRLQGRLLPRNRFDALEAITKTLIDEQPRRRAQASLQGTGPRINPRIAERGVQFLALHIFQCPGSESIVEDKAREALAQFYQGAEFRKPEADAIELASTQIESATHEVGILVQRQPEQIGFLHRSLQEFLAAQELAHRPFQDVKAFVVEKSCEPGWQEILLGTLHLLRRQDEVDVILGGVRGATSEPLDLPLRLIFLARSAFGDLNCSANLAEQIAEEIFSYIETSTWMPIRRTLVTEVVHGLDSEALGSRVRTRLIKWFPSRQRWRWGLFRRLAENPTDGTDERLYAALINADSGEHKEIAEAIALGANRWPNLSARLVNLLTNAADGDLLAAALHALATGWQSLPQLHDLLLDASESAFDNLSCVALINRVKRGEKTDELKRRLARFCQRRMHVHPWEDNLLDVLIAYWPNDPQLRAVALHSVRNKMVPTEWNAHTAFRYLIRAFPNDNDVAAIIAETLRREDRIGTEFDHSAGWKWILAGFKGHRAIVAAAEEWLEKHALASWDESSIAQVAMLAGTEKAKQSLIARLKAGKLLPQWVVSTLIKLGTANDPEIRQAVLSFIADDKRAGTVANFLPDFLDKDDSGRRLLSLLGVVRGFEIGHVLTGLDRVTLLKDPRTVAIIERRLRDDPDGHFWWNAKTHLLEFFPKNVLVRERALKELDDAEPPLYAIAGAYSQDPQVRPLLDALIQPLHQDLRLTLVQALRSFVLRENSFARDLLRSYSREWSGEVRTSAAVGCYTAIQKLRSSHDTDVAFLLTELGKTGPGYDERRQAAVGGLLILGEAQKLMEALVCEGEKGLGVRTAIEGGHNWELVRMIIESWEVLTGISGEAIWKTFPEWDVFISQLAQAGKRQLALAIPARLVAEVERQASIDVGAFRALSVLREGQQSFQEFCFGLFSKQRHDAQRTHISWGYNEVGVWFEAARYLASHYSGDAELGAQLEDIAQHSHEPSGPIAALCRGWPNSSVIERIWKSRADRKLNAEPVTAWVVSTKSTSKQFADYVVALPEALLCETWWRFPRETMRAVRRRLTADVEAQRIIIESAQASMDTDVIASVSGLLGTNARDRRLLREWARGQLKVLQKPGTIQPMGYDMLSGQVRPVEFCLLEACLTS